jgi:TonB family protein
MVAHVVLIPAIVYVSNLDINFRPAPTTIKGRTFVIVDPGSPRRPRQAPVGPVRPHSPKPAEQDRKTKNQVPKSEAPRTDRPRGARPVPAKKQQEDRPVAPVPPVDNPKPDQAPVTDPIADEGPLLAGAGPVAGSEASIGGLDGVDFPYNYYLEVVRAKVAQAWVVPQGSASRGRRIESTIRFRILRDGSVSESRVEEPSGLSIYDQAALRAVSNVRRFPPLPQEFGGEFLVVHFQFSFVGR